MKFFFVALWSRKTEAVIGQDVRLQQLKEAVDAASKAFNGINSADKFDGVIKSIFVAPEYLFTTERAEGEDTSRALPAKAVNKLASKLIALSDTYKGMLIIPGSVIYQHSIDAQVDGDKGAVESVQKYKESVNPATAKGPAANIRKNLLAPFDAESAPDEKLKKLATPQAVTEVVKNRVYVLLNGKVVAKYGKKADKHEVMGAGAALFIPGQDTGIAKIEDIEFGFEICYDHEMGVLKAVSSDKKVDIHVVVSAFVQNQTSNMQIRPRGYFLHASSDPAYSAVYYKPKTGLAVKLDPSEVAKTPDLKDQAQVIAETACAGGTLNCYVLPYLDPPAPK